MNFQKLNEFYPWQDCPTSLRGQSTLLLDSSNTSKSTLHSGFFIFVTVLLQSLQTNNKDNDKILLILTDNTKSHYDTIFKKNVRLFFIIIKYLNLIFSFFIKSILI